MVNGSRVLSQWNALNIGSGDCSELQSETAKVQAKTAKSANPARRPFQVTTGRYRFERAAHFVSAAGGPQTAAQIAAALDVTKQEAETMAERAVRAGRIRKLGDYESSKYASLALEM